MDRFIANVGLGAVVLFCIAGHAPAKAAWEPTRPVEIIVPAGTGGGADQMARVIQGIVNKRNLMNQPMVVINKPGNAGGEGFLDLKASNGNPHKLIITLSNLFTTPLSTGIAFSWRDLTPVAMMALDEFVLWVNVDAPFKSAKDYVDALRKGQPGQYKMGGTGVKQEDQIITVAMEKATGARMTYVAYRGGGEVALQLVGKQVDSTVNNPIEALAHWRAGKLRPLCVFDAKPLPYRDRIAGGQSWGDVPTCKSQGLDVEYLMLRGFFMPGGVSKEQTDYYIDLMKKILATAEWQNLMKDGAFNQTALTGPDYVRWLEDAERQHSGLMKDAGFLGSK